jgi:hypothetical protein
MKKILTLTLMSIFILTLIAGSVNAFEFDNVKTYDPIAKEITFKNSFLGIPTSEIAKVKLVDYNRYCFPGECYLKLNLDIKEGDIESLKDVIYYGFDKGANKVGGEINRVKVYEIYDPNLEYNTNVKKFICADFQKEQDNKDCFKDEVTTSKGKWVNYDPTTKLKSGIYQLRINVKVSIGETVDVVPNLYGIDVKEWALFTGMTKYEYQDATDNACTLNQAGGCITTFMAGTTGLNETFVFKGVQFRACWAGTETAYASVYPATNFSGCTFTNRIGYGELSAGGNGYCNYLGYNLTMSVNATILKNGIYCLLLNSTQNDGDPNFMEIQKSDVYSGGMLAGYSGGYVWDSAKDMKFEIWGVSGDIEPTVTLTAPSNSANIAYQNVNFLATLTDDVNVTNGTLYFNGVANTTITLGNSSILFNTTQNLANGQYNWTVLARSNTGQLGWAASNYSLVIDTVSPLVNITLPTNATNYVNTSDNYAISVNATVSDNIALSACWYYNGTGATNTSITCGANASFSITPGWTIVRWYANDTVNHVTSSSPISIFYNKIIPYVNGSATAIEGESTTIFFNITATSLTQANASLWYNGSTYQMSLISSNDTSAQFYKTLTAPLVSADTNYLYNVSYYFNNNLYNTSTYTQKIYNIPNLTVGTCSPAALTFDLVDEESLAGIVGDFEYNFYYGLSNSSIVRTYGKVTGATSFSVCVNSTISPSWTLGAGEIFYRNTTSYVDRRYYLFSGTTLTNSTTNITLHDLLSTHQTSFKLEVEDTSLNPYVDKYTTLVRWYPDLNQYKVVDMGKTDETGSTVIHVKTEDVDYRIGVYEQNGSLLKLADPIRMVCLVSPCTYSLKISPGDTDYTSFLGIQYTFTFNETTGIWLFTYSDPAQKTSTMNLTIWKDTGTTSFIACSNSVTGYSGAISCNTSGYTGTLRGEVSRAASPPVILVQKIVSIVTSAFKSPFGLWLSMLLALPVIFLLAMVSPVAAILGGIISLIPALYFGSVNIGIVGGIAVLGGIIAHFLKRVS